MLLDQAQLVMQNILYEKSFYLAETRAILDTPCGPRLLFESQVTHAASWMKAGTCLMQPCSQKT